jgi:hypothetical protein
MFQIKYSNDKTANAVNAYIGLKVKTGMQLNAEIGIVKVIDDENGAIYVVGLSDNKGGWYSINTCIAI